MAPVLGQGTPIGFEEDFALSPDRDKALEELIPGSLEHYFFATLHAQNLGRLGRADELMRAWRDRHGTGGLYQEMETRQALLRYPEDPAAAYRYLTKEFGIRFDHRREILGAVPDLPTVLDPALVGRDVFLRLAFGRGDSAIGSVKDSGLESLVGRELSIRQLRELLSRLQRPDVPGLARLVVRELADSRSRGFGSLEIHGKLLLAQLEECLDLRPELLGDDAFVSTYLLRLAPGSDDRRDDRAVREAHLDRLERFAARLPAAFDSFEAHVLYHRLWHDLAQGRPDRERLIRYLRLPRAGGYVDPEFIRRKSPVDLSRDWGTGFGAVGDDEPLVRALLAHFFADADSFEAYAGLVRRDYLERVFAETKILAGIGDMERWYSLLDDPAYYERLKGRVEIEFPVTQTREFGPEDSVSIDVDVKNVETLLVKVFEIDTLGFFDSQAGRLRDVDASIDLDGLIAHEERTFSYDEPPLRRVRRTFEFPRLAKPGVYVIDLIGNGLSSRAVIKNGRLSYIMRVGSAGHVLHVLDGNGKLLDDAAIRYAGREYTADDDGAITIPFSTDPGVRQIVLRHGDLGVLDSFQHQAESYALEAPVHVEREALVAGETASLLVRPRLTVNGERVSLSLLKDVTLQVESRDLNGIASTQTVRDFALTEGRESTHEIQVPPRTASIQVSLTATVENLSTGKDDPLASPVAQFPVNGIDRTDAIASALLTRTPAGYAIDVLGKNGEAIADQVLRLTFEHEDFTGTVSVALKSDARGRIALGALSGIEKLSATGLASGGDQWWLGAPARTGHARELHGIAGSALRVPYEGASRALDRSVASLLELRGGAFAFDRFDRLALTNGFLELRGLAAGDYLLTLDETGESFDVKTADGTPSAGWAPAAVADEARRLQLTDPTPLHLTGAAVEGEELIVRTANAGPRARVHVFATRYLPAYDPHARLALPPHAALAWEQLASQLAQLESGREIGDEYRYILERRLAEHYPGNMLARAGLLLNPWALQERTPDVIGLGGGAGGRFGGSAAGRRARGSAAGGDRGRSQQGRGSAFANLDFLPAASASVANLIPDADGLVRVPLADLGDEHVLTVLLVDDDVTLSRRLVRPEGERETRDVRLIDGLDPKRHLTEQRRIEYVAPGAEVVLADAANAGAQTFDTLASVFQLFQTRSGNADLDQFSFLLRWPELDDDEQRARYSEFACHELHVFLHEKDSDFFEAVVRPYIRSKLEKTFIDRWLLGEDLTSFLEPKSFSRLNVVERVLLLRGIGNAGPRHLREALELLPPDAFALATYFDSVLASGGLAAKNEVGAALGEARKRAIEDRIAFSKDPVPPGAKAAAPEALADAPEEMEEPAFADEVAPGLERQGELAGEDDSYFDRGEADKDVARRGLTSGFFRDLEDTQELAENHYWHVPRQGLTAELIRPNPFWLDFAEASPDAPFHSARFPVATGSLAEMLLALAFLDLPFTAAEHEIEAEGRKLTLRAGSGLFLARKELAGAAEAEDAASILIGQDLFRLAEPHVFVDGKQRDRFVTEEFLRGEPYGCRVVVTNPGSAQIDVELLLQIPHGALPVRAGFVTRGVPVTLGGYQSHSVEYAFYFPVSGDYEHYPVHVGEDGTLLGYASAAPLHVVDEPSTIDTTSWDHVSQAGEVDEVFGYLEGANLGRIDLSRIAWRMADRAVYDRALEYLRSRQTFDPVLWSYSLKHTDERGAREFLRHRQDVLGRCGPAFESALVSIDPVEWVTYQFLEYDPLVNGRAHRFGDNRTILNYAFAAQYQNFLRVLAYRPELSPEERLAATYYYSLQDRVGEALSMFATVDRETIETRLQYDYMQAYLDFYSGDVERARRIAEAHAEHPVARWRARFRDVVAQLDEARGGAPAGVSDPDSTGQRQGALAASQPALELEVEARRIALSFANLKECEVSYREMDIELLFSTNPFMQAGSSSFAAIKPNRADRVSLPANATTHAFDLPAQFQSSNVLVEVRAAGLVKRKAYYSNNLTVQGLERYGQIRVSKTDGSDPLPAAYVKVYARLADGRIRFHKDGYTDLRGRFDYVSLSGMDGAQIERYAILVMSENDGALVRELAPPVR